jgi:hypothetical protein
LVAAALLPGLEITYPQGDLYNNVTGQYRYTKLVIVCSTIEEDAHWRLVKIAEAAEVRHPSSQNAQSSFCLCFVYAFIPLPPTAAYNFAWGPAGGLD